MTGVHKTNEGVWTQIVASAAVPVYGVAYYDTANSFSLSGNDCHPGVHPITGDFYAVICDPADDYIITRFGADIAEFEELSYDDDADAGAETDMGRVCATANGNFYYERNEGGSLRNMIRAHDPDGTVQWGHHVNTNLGSEVIGDFVAFTDPNTGADRLFVFVAHSTTDEMAVFEVDISSPGSNAVGSRMNVQWQHNKVWINGSTSMIYDHVNHKIVVGGSSIGYSVSDIFTVLVFDPDDTTTGALEQQVYINNATYDASVADDEHYSLAYDEKNDHYIVSCNRNNATSTHNLVRLNAADLSIASSYDFGSFGAGNIAGITCDNSGNIYIFNTSNNEIACIDDTWTVKWQIDHHRSGLLRRRRCELSEA